MWVHVHDACAAIPCLNVVVVLLRHGLYRRRSWPSSMFHVPLRPLVARPSSGSLVEVRFFLPS